MAPFLRNAWYVAGWGEEVADELLVRKILGISLVFFRTSDGRVAALEDRCPHRYAPLSLGIRKPDSLQCHYHGLTFDAQGACVDNPLGGRIPAACKVSSFPVVEQDTILWIWMGDAARADTTLIPRFEFFNDPGMRNVRGYTWAKAHYELMTDNLMDLTHARFLHPCFGGDHYNPSNTMEVDGDQVISHYLVQDVENPEFPEVAWSSHGKNVDLWDDIRWIAPAILSLDSGVVLTGRPRSEGCSIPSAHLLTPETEGSTHYFWGSGVAVESPLDADGLRAVLSQAFDTEDKPMIEAAFERMEGQDFWALKPVLLPTDAPGIRVRRILAEKIKREAEQCAA